MVKSPAYGITFNRTSEVVPGVFLLVNRGVNKVLIVEEQLTLVDCGLPGGSRQLVDLIDSLGRSVAEISLIIITHNHIDHIGGLAELKEMTGATVAIHRDGILDTGDDAPYPGAIRRLLKVPLLADMRRRFLLSPDDADRLLEDGVVLPPLGGLRVVHTPGHTPCSISLYSPRHKLLLVSDALVRSRNNPQFPHRMVSSNFTIALDSIKKMAQLDVDILCFGHGRPLMADVPRKMQDLVRKIKD